jgi:hypothetical protein
MFGGDEARTSGAFPLIHRQSFHFDTEDTGPAYTHRCKLNTAEGPWTPSHTPLFCVVLF